MTPELFRQAREIFDQALDLPPERRAVFLSTRCAGDAALRTEVESLLASSRVAEGSLREAVKDELLILDREVVAVPGRIGPYMVLREIGRGGMGAVYLAERSDRELEGQVAIKLVKRGMDTDDILRRFRDERRILSTLSHPNVARLLDGGTTEDGLPYFVMEYVEGEHLLEYAEKRRLPLAARIGLFRGVCDAVSYAHRNLVVHRDIKPGNILVTADGTPKLLDFGLAKVLDPAAEGSGASTLYGQRMLTPDYASPEQIRGERVTTSSDVFSLGVVLYRLLAGGPPFPAVTKNTAAALGSPEEIGRAVLEQEPRSARGQLGEELDTILRKALEKETARRYPSVEQMSEDLRRHLEGLPVLARKDTLTYRARKFVSRHRLAVGAAALAATLLSATTGIAIWQARRALQKEALARKRFGDVRQLANATLFEFHDAIKDLSGSTAARSLLVRRGLLYLNALAEEARDDRALQRELASAYLKVASIQGGTFEGNLGDTAGARRSLAKATAILDALARSGVTGPEEARLLAEDQMALGVTRLGMEEPAQSVAAFRTAVALLESIDYGASPSREDRKRLALAQGRMARAMMEDGRMKEALAPTLSTLQLLERIVAEAPDDRAQVRRLAITHNQAANIQRGQEPAAAVDSHERALALQRQLVAAEPDNAQLRRELAWTYVDLSETLALLGVLDRAAREGREAVAIFERLAAADEKNVNDRTELANALNVIGEPLLQAGDVPGARAVFEGARSAAGVAVERDPESAFAGSILAGAHLGLGRVELAEAGRPGPAREAVRRRGCGEIARSLELYGALDRTGRLAGPYRSSYDRARREAAGCS